MDNHGTPSTWAEYHVDFLAFRGCFVHNEIYENIPLPATDIYMPGGLIVSTYSHRIYIQQRGTSHAKSS